MLRKIKELLSKKPKEPSKTHVFLVFGYDSEGSRCFTTITAESGEEAIELAKVKKPGCNFTSYMVL